MKTIIIGTLLSPLLLMAQQDSGVWTHIGPSPAGINAPVVADPRGSGSMFIGLFTGGIRKSTDSGVTWSTVNTGLTDLRILTFAMDASGPETVYAGAFGGLFKSTNGGGSWQNLATISGSVTCVTADPKRSGVVYAWVNQNLTNGSIRKSADGGATWSTIFPTTAPIFNITVDPANSDILYAPTMGRGAFKSTDGGQQWSPISALSPTAISIIVVDPVDSQVLYAGTNDDGVWKSRDGGATWQNLGFPSSLPVYSLTIDRSPLHAVYAGTNGGGIWRSSDGGISWQSTGLSSGRVMSLSMDFAGALYASTSSAGAQVSHDRGLTWRTLDAGIAGTNKFAYGCWIDPGNGQKIFASSPTEYLNWSQDGGATWSAAGQGFSARGSRGVAFDPSNPRRIYAGGTVGDGVFRSDDGGLTWARSRFGSTAVNVIPVAVDSVSPNIVYTGTQNEGLFKSVDFGDTWMAAGSGLSGAITSLKSDSSKSGRLFAATSTAFFLSEDYAETWTIILNRPAWTITIDSKAPSTIYATTRTQGVFRSLDGGRTWQEINNGLTSLTLGRAPVTIDPANPQTLYVGNAGGVFKSLDGGDHWFAVNSGLGDLSVWGLVMDPDNSSVLYACGPSGIYKTLTGGEVGSVPTISAVLNGARYLAGPVSPDEIVVITGSGLGPGQLILATPGNDGMYSSTQLSGTTVQFNGTAAPVIYVSGNQVAVRVPLFSVGPAQVTVTYEGRTSAPFLIQVTQNSPGLFTLDSSGKGQAVAINRDGSINSPATPAVAGDVISVYGTGVTAGQGGVDLVIGGQTTSTLPGSSFKYGSSGGVTRFDVRIPSGIFSNPGVPVLVQVVQGDMKSSQPGVTIAIQEPHQTATDTSIGWATAVTTGPAGNGYFISSNTVFRVDPKGILSRVAGNLHPGYSGDGGPAIDAQLFTDDVISEAPFFGVRWRRRDETRVE